VRLSGFQHPFRANTKNNNILRRYILWFLCLTDRHAIKAYGGVEEEFHTLALAMHIPECSISHSECLIPGEKEPYQKCNWVDPSKKKYRCWWQIGPRSSSLYI